VWGADHRPHVPNWLFWAVASLIAVGAGIGVASFSSDESESPPHRRLKAVGATKRHDGRQSSSHLASASEKTPSPSSQPGDPTETGGSSDESGRGVGTVTIQVLNATTERRADNRLARRLRHFGYNVVVLNRASKIYRHTTVYWSHSDSKQASIDLARRFSWPARHKPRNLSDSVTTHVVVGQDER
jgi:LytR cell envelope-related transcriptional attenuator